MTEQAPGIEHATGFRFRRMTAADVRGNPAEAGSHVPRGGTPRLPNATTLAEASRIVDDVRECGWEALVRHAIRLGDFARGDRLVWSGDDLMMALEQIAPADRALLERVASRIRAFAEAQRRSLVDVRAMVPGGRAGHTVTPVASAACYAPGGRFPLPSSVLMTAVTARAAGVPIVWVASPRPAPATLAAAAIAGADGVVGVGGAQVVAAFAFGAGPVPRCDLIVGPGNRWVTAAKQLVAGQVGIDMLAGPSELVVLADETADAALVAADLLAQAKHDPDAVPVLVTTSQVLLDAVEREIAAQLADLPAAEQARVALANGGAVLTRSTGEAIDVCDDLAPEHVQVMTRDAREVGARLGHYGALFIGDAAAEVLGDYGAGPNHVLPTGGSARFSGGLSVLTFLRVRSWLELDDAAAAQSLVEDAVALGRLEGLEAHARAAERRRDRGAP